MSRKSSFAADEQSKMMNILDTQDEEEENKKKPRPLWVVSNLIFKASVDLNLLCLGEIGQVYESLVSYNCHDHCHPVCSVWR